MTLVIGSGIQDPDNVGSIVRSCAAFGVAALILGPGCADPFSRRALRVSMGNAFQLPIMPTSELTTVLRELRTDWNVEIAATVLDGDAEPLESVNRSERFALLFGSEGFGLEADLVAQCDRKVTLPMRLNTDSLNVAVAAGVFLYHFTR
jgi:tRNA G18 (ribose-2'-O)-methylase SpoU